jgi:hypothetical protein
MEPESPHSRFTNPDVELCGQIGVGSLDSSRSSVMDIALKVGMFP